MQSFFLVAWRWNKRQQKCSHERDWPIERECEGVVCVVCVYVVCSMCMCSIFLLYFNDYQTLMTSFIIFFFLTQQFCLGRDITCAIQANNTVSEVTYHFLLHERVIVNVCCRLLVWVLM